MSAKRKRTANEDERTNTTPRKKNRQTSDIGGGDDRPATATPLDTPTKNARMRPAVSRETHETDFNGTPNGHAFKTATPRSSRRVFFSTPVKAHDRNDETETGTPTIVRNADRSARRKSARRLIERTMAGDESDDDGLDEDEEDELAAEILGREDDQETDEEELDESPAPETPSRRGRGRAQKDAKQKRRARSITPPVDLPPQELYFWQNRARASKTSSNTLAATKLLNHEEYFHAMQTFKDRHEPEKEFLHELHNGAFDQWAFELSEGFNICLYGYGSKRKLAESFVAHLYDSLAQKSPAAPKILIVDGFDPGTTIKDVLLSVALSLLPCDPKKPPKLPSQVAPLLYHTLSALSSQPTDQKYYILINTIDSPNLRKAPGPSMLAALAASPRISFVATADNPNFPLLWDSSLLSQYRFVFHDATTFQPYDAEINVVDEVNTLLGRTGRRIQGKDGVNWVLRSLPQNARALFTIIVSEQLAAIDEVGMEDSGPFMDLPTIDELETPAAKAKRKLAKQARQQRVGPPGVEYRVLYHKAVEAFICTSEVAFRTLLKEFHDHQMVESRKDAMGTEKLYVPFRKEELESLLEELAADDT